MKLCHRGQERRPLSAGTVSTCGGLTGYRGTWQPTKSPTQYYISKDRGARCPCGPSASWPPLHLVLNHMEISRQYGLPTSIPRSSRCICGGPDVGQVGEVPCNVTRSATSRPSPCDPVTNGTTRWTRPRRTRGRGQAVRQCRCCSTSCIIPPGLDARPPLWWRASLPPWCSLQSESSPPRQSRPACQRHTALHQTRLELDKASPDACWDGRCVLSRAKSLCTGCVWCSCVCVCVRARASGTMSRKLPRGVPQRSKHPLHDILCSLSSQWWTVLAVRLRCI